MGRAALNGEWSLNAWDASATIVDEYGDSLADIRDNQTAQRIVEQHNETLRGVREQLQEALGENAQAIKSRDGALSQLIAVSQKAGFYDGLSIGLADALKLVSKAYSSGNQRSLDQAMDHVEAILKIYENSKP